MYFPLNMLMIYQDIQIKLLTVCCCWSNHCVVYLSQETINKGTIFTIVPLRRRENVQNTFLKGFTDTCSYTPAAT